MNFVCSPLTQEKKIFYASLGYNLKIKMEANFVIKWIFQSKNFFRLLRVNNLVVSRFEVKRHDNIVHHQLYWKQPSDTNLCF
jgi:hypothetical protein